MLIKVKRQIGITDGERRRALLVEGNPHDVSDDVAHDLIRRKLAEPSAGSNGGAVETTSETSIDDMTVPELKAVAKQRNIAGYSSMNRGELLLALGADGDDQQNGDEGLEDLTDDDLVALAGERNIADYESMGRAELIAALSTTGGGE